MNSDEVKYVLNAHGDVVALLNANGVVTKRYDYDAFGNELSIDNTDTNPFRYCAECFDAETGQIYLRARYYSPVTGRFTQLEPIRDGLNWYAYCGNNPIVFVDPSGLVIHIVGNGEQVSMILADLQALTDYKLGLNDSGNVIITDRPDETYFDGGNILIERLIESTYTCNIMFTVEDNYEFDANSYNATNGIGTDTLVGINIDSADNTIPTYGTLIADNLEETPRPLYIAFAHELIHTDRSMRGVAIPYNDDYTYEHYYKDSTGELKDQTVKIEEMMTMGLYCPGYNASSVDITENQIRAEHQLRIRGKY